MKNLFTLITAVAFATTAFSQTPTIIGTTTYDYQSYGSSLNHLIAYTDGKVSASWMGCSNLAAFGSLGTYFNHFNGISWGAFPTSRVEGQKIYSTDMVKVLDHEVVLADDISKLRVYKNTAIGSTSWSETGGSHILDQWYNYAFCPAGTDDVYVVGVKPPGASGSEDLLFSRSDDGGESWAVSELALPYTTEAYGCDIVLSGAYQIVAKGNDVWVLYGSLISDLILMHSDSKGDAGTWDLEATLLDFPIDNYTAGSGETTDFDGDGDYDWLDTNDGMHEMLITNDGIVHVFSGRMQIRDVSGVTGFYYDYTKGGIYHWKTGDAAATLYEGFMIDWNGDGNPMSGITTNYDAYYYESFTCMPTASYDASIDRLYLAYMMPVEDEVSASNQNYFDLFGSYSDDGGTTWSDPINLTYKAYKGQENAFPSANPMVIDNKFQIMWQQDNEPGTSVDAPADDAVYNNILYVAWDSTRFQPYDPTVDFSYVITAVGASYNVAFTNLSFDAETYYWTFGDGGTSTLENPTHLYSEGVYEVCLTGYNHYGDATTCQTIVASNAPVADFNYTGDPTVAFTDASTGGTPTEWDWDFGDGGTSTLENPSHTYAANGTYNVCLTVSNLAGSSTHCENVVIDSYVTPTAAFTWTGDPTVTFTDLTTGAPTEWDWDFDDGGTSTLQNPVHTYASNGTYHVCLTATNAFGDNTSCHDVVIDSYVLPVINFIYAGDPLVAFTDLSSGGPTDWDWDFGDGGSSVLQNPTHSYAENGSYNVCLTATNDVGSATDCEVVIINGYLAPVALFTYSGDPDVSFTDLSTNSPTTWLWDFGDGAFSTLQDPDHSYADNGTYLVCLTVDGPGGSDTYCDNIDIELAELAPVADFDYAVSGSLTLDFTDLSINEPTSWEWDFGDESISFLQNPIHTYAIGGNYQVCLTATNDVASDEVCKSVYVPTSVANNPIVIAAVFPNPAVETITIQTDEMLNDYLLSISNVLGEKVLETGRTGTQLNSVSLDVSDFAAGNYFIVIITAEKTFVCEFVKKR